jgi:hypothetical protein
MQRRFEIVNIPAPGVSTLGLVLVNITPPRPGLTRSSARDRTANCGRRCSTAFRASWVRKATKRPSAKVSNGMNGAINETNS